MKIIAARTEYLLDTPYNNTPHLAVLVDRLPPQESLRWHERHGLYWAERDGYVDHLFHSGDPVQQEGYCGRTFELTMFDGTTRTLHGPWSSNYLAVNKMTPLYCLDVSIGEVYGPAYRAQDPHGKWHASIAGCLTMERVLEAAALVPAFGKLYTAVADINGWIQPILVKGSKNAGKLFRPFLGGEPCSTGTL